MTHDKRILEILNTLSANVATILEEQQSQRMDIRSLQREVSNIKETMVTKKELKKELTQVRNELTQVKNELKADIHDLRAEVTRTLKAHDKRLSNLEEHTGITDPTKH